MKNKQFAIWAYDLPPYYLGGTVKNIEGEWIITEEYPTLKFKYIRLYSLEEGMKVYDLIKSYGEKYERSLKDIKDLLIFNTTRVLGLTEDVHKK